MKILGRPIHLGDPESADIVIFSEANNHEVRNALNRKHSIAIFNQQPEDIWIGFRVTSYFFLLIGQFDYKEAIKHQHGAVRGVLSQLKSIYIESCLVAMKPKAVVTFIDNDINFHRLSKRCRKFPFIAIQNGFRPRPAHYDTHDHSRYYLQHLFCMGHHAKELFPKMGYCVENFYPVGSLRASLYFDHKRLGYNEKYDMLVVSSWCGNTGYHQETQDIMRSMKIMDNLLAKYIAERGIKAAVILRSERDSEHWSMPEIGKTEEDYYREIYGNRIEIIDNTYPPMRNVYPLMQESRVIVTCLSSALIDAFGIGKKVFFCDFIGSDWYYRDLPPSIVTNNSNYKFFTDKLDELQRMPHEEYLQINQESQKHYMTNPHDRLTYQAIAEGIDQIIENTNDGLKIEHK
jgi:surface carbohydrate biosynthesis protein